MVPNGAATSEGPERSASNPPTEGRLTAVGVPRFKLALFAAVLLSLLAVVLLAVVREAAMPPRAVGARPALTPARPALGAAEEVYARALWSIHGDVKDGAYQMTFGGLKYKLGEIDGVELQARLRAASEAYRTAELRVRALTPPPSLQAVHVEYLAAIRLYRDSVAEMIKVTEDGRHDHLTAALPLSQEGSRKLLRVGKDIWPGEYVPN